MQCRTLMGNVIARFPAATLHACHVERVYLRSPLPWVRLRSLQVLSAVDSFVPKLVRVAHRHLPCPLLLICRQLIRRWLQTRKLCQHLSI